VAIRFCRRSLPSGWLAAGGLPGAMFVLSSGGGSWPPPDLRTLRNREAASPITVDGLVPFPAMRSGIDRVKPGEAANARQRAMYGLMLRGKMQLHMLLAIA
jgi:hypothetical protein